MLATSSLLYRPTNKRACYKDKNLNLQCYKKNFPTKSLHFTTFDFRAKRYASTFFFKKRKVHVTSEQALVSNSDKSSHTPVSIERKPVKLLVKYSFDNETHVKAMKVWIDESKQVLTLEDLRTYLVEDKINLRTVSNIRWYKASVGGFVNVSEKGIALSKIQDNTLRLELEKSRSKALVMGPIASFDPNVGFILDTLNPFVKMKFFAGGKLFSRSYQALMNSLGPKIDLSVRCQAAFAIRTPFKALYYHDEIELGKGIDIVWSPFHITWVSFKESSGGILFVGAPLGLAFGISIIKSGGVLRPVVDEEDGRIPEPPPPKPKRVKSSTEIAAEEQSQRHVS